jgi:hypothetical protein
MARPNRPRLLREGNSSRPLEVRQGEQPVRRDDPEPDIPPLELEKRGTLYLVKRQRYRSRNNPGEPIEGKIEAIFSNPLAAEAWIRERVRSSVRSALRWWRQYPHFHLGRTSLPPELLRDLVLDMGLEPPGLAECRDNKAWQAWCEQQAPLMDDWQLERFLLALDQDDRYVVVPIDLCE